MFTVLRDRVFNLKLKEIREDGSGTTPAGNNANRWPFTPIKNDSLLGHIGGAGSMRRVLDAATLGSQKLNGLYQSYLQIMSIK